MIQTEVIATKWMINGLRKLNSMVQTSSISVQWSNTEENRIEWRFSGNWDSEEYFEAVQKIWDYADSKTTPIDLVVDLRHSERHPGNLTTLIRSAFRSTPCSIQRSVVISPTNFWRRVFEIISQTDPLVARMPTFFVSSPEAAEILLRMPPLTTKPGA